MAKKIQHPKLAIKNAIITNRHCNSIYNIISIWRLYTRQMNQFTYDCIDKILNVSLWSLWQVCKIDVSFTRFAYDTMWLKWMPSTLCTIPFHIFDLALNHFRLWYDRRYVSEIFANSNKTGRFTNSSKEFISQFLSSRNCFVYDNCWFLSLSHFRHKILFIATV